MPYFSKPLHMNVYEAAEKRVLQVFSENYRVDVSFSGGKDSIATLIVVINTMRKYGIDFKRLSVSFVDEEAIFPDVPDIVMYYRRMIMSYGGTFNWLCLPWKHFNCTNTLNDEETWTCWDMRARDKWVRPMPAFALRWHPDFKYGMSYQEFFDNLARKHSSFVQIIGVRASESLQRTQFLRKKSYSLNPGNNYKKYVIYDWKDSDVWKCIMENHAEFPKTYMNLWRIGAKMRMSQIFSQDTCRSIPHMLKFYPQFYDALQRRCPNIDIVLLYFDTRMFKGGGQDRKFNNTLTEDEYRVKIRNMINDKRLQGKTGKGFKNGVNAWQRIQVYENLPAKLYKSILKMLDGGDPKCREYRAFLTTLNAEMNNRLKNGK